MTASNRSSATAPEARAKVVSTAADAEVDAVITVVVAEAMVAVEDAVVTTIDVAAESHPPKLPPQVSSHWP